MKGRGGKRKGREGKKERMGGKRIGEGRGKGCVMAVSGWTPLYALYYNVMGWIVWVNITIPEPSPLISVQTWLYQLHCKVQFVCCLRQMFLLVT